MHSDPPIENDWESIPSDQLWLNPNYVWIISFDKRTFLTSIFNVILAGLEAILRLWFLEDPFTASEFLKVAISTGRKFPIYNGFAIQSCSSTTRPTRVLDYTVTFPRNQKCDTLMKRWSLKCSDRLTRRRSIVIIISSSRGEKKGNYLVLKFKKCIWHVLSPPDFPILIKQIILIYIE